MKLPPRLSDGLARLWRWGDKWLVHIWLGIPLTFGLMGWWHGGLDQYQDLGKYAANAPRIERQGLIKKVDLRGDRHVLITDNDRIAITCSVPSNGLCLKHITPLRAKVKYFKYRGQYIVIDLIRDDGNHLIKENDEVKSWLNAMYSYREDSTQDAIVGMMLLSFVLVIPFMIGIPIIRWNKNRNINKKDGCSAR